MVQKKSGGNGESQSESPSSQSQSSISTSAISTVAAVVHALLSGGLTEDQATQKAISSLTPLLPKEDDDDESTDESTDETDA